MVMNVDPRGPGAKAAVYEGGIVIDWNGEPIRNVQSVLHALADVKLEMPAGEPRQSQGLIMVKAVSAW